MIAFLVTMGLLFGQPSTRCHYSAACAFRGDCDVDPKRPDSDGCYTASESSCNHSFVCAAWGNCRWREGMRYCYGDDPGMCGPDKSPCKQFGHCKVAKTGKFMCTATKDGCAQSEQCRRSGSCGLSAPRDGLRRCEPTRKGCKESLDCKRRGTCAFDSKRRDCTHDPKACLGAERCRAEGSCSSNGGICAHLSHEDCQRGEICATYGCCHQRHYVCDPYGEPGLCAGNSCSARSDEDCAGSRVCKAYGACTRVADPAGDYCAVHAKEASPCAAEPAPVREVIASSTHPDWAGYAFDASHLVDDVSWTAWAPDPSASGNARLKFVFERKVPIVGLRLGNGFQRVDPVEGIVTHAFGGARGLVVRVDGRPYEVKRFVEWADLQEMRFPPVEVGELEIELFDVYAGDRFAVPGLSLLMPLTCSTPACPVQP